MMAMLPPEPLTGLPLAALTALTALAALGALAVLTGLGARRRGNGVPAAVLAGLCFPLTWVAWYVVDERRRQPAPDGAGGPALAERGPGGRR